MKRIALVVLAALGLAAATLSLHAAGEAQAEVVCTVTSNGGVRCINRPDPTPTPKEPRGTVQGL